MDICTHTRARAHTHTHTLVSILVLICSWLSIPAGLANNVLSGVIRTQRNSDSSAIFKHFRWPAWHVLDDLCFTLQLCSTTVCFKLNVWYGVYGRVVHRLHIFWNALRSSPHVNVPHVNVPALSCPYIHTHTRTHAHTPPHTRVRVLNLQWCKPTPDHSRLQCTIYHVDYVY